MHLFWLGGLGRLYADGRSPPPISSALSFRGCYTACCAALVSATTSRSSNEHILCTRHGNRLPHATALAPDPSNSTARSAQQMLLFSLRCHAS